MTHAFIYDAIYVCKFPSSFDCYRCDNTINNTKQGKCFDCPIAEKRPCQVLKIHDNGKASIRCTDNGQLNYVNLSELFVTIPDDADKDVDIPLDELNRSFELHGKYE